MDKATVMREAWAMWRAHYNGRPWIKPNFRRDFGDFLSIAWRKHFAYIDNRAPFERYPTVHPVQWGA